MRNRGAAGQDRKAAVTNLQNITVGITSTDRTRAIIDGRVVIDGVKAELRIDEPQPIFRAAQRDSALDVAELSLGTHLVQTDAGTAAYWAIPVFLSRAFRHNAIHIRTDRSIATVADLNGRRIGIQGFQQTATIWARGILAEHYGFEPATVQWVVAGLDKAGDLERTALHRPLTMRAEPAGTNETLDGLLRAGTIDAVISPAAPPCSRDPAVPVARLFPDPAAEERRFFTETGFFPVMHVLGVKKTLAAEHPMLPRALFAAFAEAKSRAQADLLRDNYLRSSLPWQTEAARLTRSLMGPNPWRYGFAGNLAELQALVRHAARDGLVAPDLDAASLFHPSTLDLADPDDAHG